MLKLINEQNKEANEEDVEREISKKEFKNGFLSHFCLIHYDMQICGYLHW